MKGFLQQFNPIRSFETEEQVDNVTSFIFALTEEKVGIDRKRSKVKWAQTLAKIKRKHEDFQEVFDWLIKNYSKLWFLSTAIQSPSALHKKWEQVIKWKGNSNQTIYEIGDNETMQAVYAEHASKYVHNFALLPIDEAECAYIMFEFVEFIRDAQHRIKQEFLVTSTKHTYRYTKECALLLNEYMEAIPYIDEYLSRIFKDLEIWSTSGRMLTDRIAKTNLVPREGNKKSLAYVRWIMNQKMKGTHLALTKQDVMKRLTETYEKSND